MSSIPPRQYQKLKLKFPDFVAAVENLGKTVRQQGPIDDKTTQLVQLAAAAAIRSEGAVHSHTKRALDAGASPDEIQHALILLANTIGFPTVIAALSWVDDILGA